MVFYERTRSQFTNAFLAPALSIDSLVTMLQVYFIAKFLKFLQMQNTLDNLYNDDSDSESNKNDLEGGGADELKSEEQFEEIPRPTSQEVEDVEKER